LLFNRYIVYFRRFHFRLSKNNGELHEFHSISLTSDENRGLSNVLQFFLKILILVISLLQHHQLRLGQRPPLHALAEVLQAPVAQISSKERQRRPRQHLAQTELELDLVACGVSTPTTAPESKCKQSWQPPDDKVSLIRFPFLVAQFQSW